MEMKGASFSGMIEEGPEGWWGEAGNTGIVFPFPNVLSQGQESFWPPDSRAQKIFQEKIREPPSLFPGF